MPQIYLYDRQKAVAYAHDWAYRRNPKYHDFQNLGGDCTNFASQCIHAGAAVMHYSPHPDWYYRSARDRSPSWTGVEFLHEFLVNNDGVGPFAVETDIDQAEPGDIIQLRFSGQIFQHSPVVIQTGETPSVHNILIAAHTYDTDYRPLDTYDFEAVRCLHIMGVRK